jgi:hypothetical protein
VQLVAPEFLIAGLLAFQGKPGAALGALPVAYMLSSSGLAGLPLDA